MGEVAGCSVYGNHPHDEKSADTLQQPDLRKDAAFEHFWASLISGHE